jgi:hypothetical protein
MNATPKFKAGSFLKGMRDWYVDLGQLERLKATAKEGLQEVNSEGGKA